MYFVMMMYEDPDLEGREFAAVCEWDARSMRDVVECATVAVQANEKCAFVQHVAFDALSLSVYEVYSDDAEQVVTERSESGNVLSFEPGRQWYVSDTNPFDGVNPEQEIRTDLDNFLVRIIRSAGGEPSILSFSWEVYEKHSAAHIHSPLVRPHEMGEAFKRLGGPLPAAIRLGYGVFGG